MRRLNIFRWGRLCGEYAGAANKDRLLSLLLPVQRASETCPWLKAMVDAGEIFHPLRWTPSEAMQLLRDVPQLESAGVVVRMPATWRGNRPPRPQVSAQIGGKAPSGLGQDALLDFQMEVTLDGERLTAAEIRGVIGEIRWAGAGPRPLGGSGPRAAEPHDGALPRGRAHGSGEWARLSGGRAFARRRRCPQPAMPPTDAAPSGLRWSPAPGSRRRCKGSAARRDWREIDPGAALKATLRPYQQVGVRWLYLLAKLGLGACLADDMGLGKTIQVLSLLLVLKRQTAGQPQPSLLVAPASLLANWASEIERFAPGLKALIAHPSALPAAELKSLAPERLRDVDLVITSYGSLLRMPWIAEAAWRLAVLDEAQAIKNPDAKQTRDRQGAEGAGAIRAHRHARREPAGRSVVHFRLRQSGAAGIVEGVHQLRQSALRTGRTIPTARCASWCGPTFCGG